ncbi:hypothetical protein [Aquimarina sp. 2201CG14-23]|uniref:hypothetical protein n=1 Tax=Aquimarina mycalae TaxID=3040073 RepID=UPI0024780BAC|nr:hypothetical protein [Aquimarina sp. 2201CG14-23]MDH7445865.1 hypothetical protein [Aquimarina sp. 2201CG14-23]
MKNLLLIGSFLILLSSCVPTKIAPNIEDYKVTIGKKFKKQLPKRTAFIFEDPKNANEFYQFINAKFKLNNEDVRWNVPFTVNNEEYFLSFYEVERSSNTINLAPMAIDAILDVNEGGPVLEDFYTSRSGKWYVALTVNDNDFMDPLKENYLKRDEIVIFLKQLKNEYLSTSNYKKYLLID